MPKGAADHLEEDIAAVQILNPDGGSNVLLVCEHASNKIPKQYDGLGLNQGAQQSHVAWDPGAFAVAVLLSEQLDAPLVAGRVSRLIYDCNRPPEAPDAIPTRSELLDIPGNMGISAAERTHRISNIYRPFQDALASITTRKSRPDVLVTVHSFTPVFLGKPRAVEIGILHDSDRRLADAMLRVAKTHTRRNVLRNQPYTAEDGVTHTLKLHGVRNNLLNVMLEIRNDLISTGPEQRHIANEIAAIIRDALVSLGRASARSGIA